MFKLALIVVSLFVASSYAALSPSVSPVCPTNAGRLLLSDSNLGVTPGFIYNVFVYTGGGQPLMSGVPLGPYIGLQQGLNCYFIPNSTLSCPINIYSDAAHTNLIGTGQLSSNSLTTTTDSQGNVYIGGSVNVTTNIPGGSLTDAAHINFVSNSFNLFYEPTRVFPTDLSQPPLLNTIQYSSSDSGMITMWGGNGWNGTDYVSTTRTTGLDLRFSFSCPNIPPIIVTCPPCLDTASNFVIPTACTTDEIPVHHHSDTTCITFTFTQSSDISSGSGCSDISG